MNTPPIRFKEFNTEWKSYKLGDLFQRITLKNDKNNTNVLTISAQDGLVSQEDFFTKLVSSQNLKGYVLLNKNDFAYNKSYSNGYPMGAIKKLNKYDKGVVSPLYICFNIKDKKLNDSFFEHYFEAGFINKEIHKFAQEGARNHGLLNIGISDFFQGITLHAPDVNEQNKISGSLNSVNELIKLLEQQISLLIQYKKGLIKSLLTQKVRFKDFNGKSYPDWQVKKLGDIFIKNNHRNSDNDINNVLSNSASLGIINQRDFFNKDIANQENLRNYLIVNLNDFIYNPRISNLAPYGPIKRNKLVKGIMSPLYMVFTPINGNIDFLETYFDSPLWHRYMYKIANYGARHDRLSITQKEFLEMPIPFPSLIEQEKIASVFTPLNELIEFKNQQLRQIIIWKKGLYQKLFI